MATLVQPSWVCTTLCVSTVYLARHDLSSWENTGAEITSESVVETSSLGIYAVPGFVDPVAFGDIDPYLC